MISAGRYQNVIGRRQAESYDFFLSFSLDIVRCPVKLRYYLKFHGACTAFDRVIEGKMISFAHIGRVPYELCLKFKSYDSNGDRSGTVRCPAGHRTMSDKRQGLTEIS